MCRRLSGFRWSSINVKISLSFATLIGAVHVGFLMLSVTSAALVGAAATLASAIVSARVLYRLADTEQFPGGLSRLIRFGKGKL